MTDATVKVTERNSGTTRTAGKPSQNPLDDDSQVNGRGFRTPNSIRVTDAGPPTHLPCWLAAACHDVGTQSAATAFNNAVVAKPYRSRRLSGSRFMGRSLRVLDAGSNDLLPEDGFPTRPPGDRVTLA